MVFVQRNNGVICGLYAIAQYEADGVTPIATEELADDNAEVVAYRNPPAPPPSTPILACLANLVVNNGDVQTVETGATGLAFAFAVSPNVIWAYFTDTLPDTTYSANVNSTSGSARVTDRQTDHVEITITDPTEPYTIFVQIFRTI